MPDASSMKCLPIISTPYDIGNLNIRHPLMQPFNPIPGRDA